MKIMDLFFDSMDMMHMDRHKKQERHITEALNDLTRKSLALMDAQTKCDEKAQLLSQQEDALLRKAQELEQKERQLSSKEEQLKACEQDMQSKIRLYDQEQQEYMDLSAARYRAEREALNALMQRQDTKSQPEVLEEFLDRTSKDFRSVMGLMKELQESLRTLNISSRQQNSRAFRELCWLHRELSGFRNPDADSIAAKLSIIMQQEFGLIPIDPTPGEEYDSTYHTRNDSSNTGSTIRFCKYIGWKWSQEVFRAIVETE